MIYRLGEDHSLRHADSQELASRGEETHSLIVAYLFWIFGFTGSHRFFLGKPLTGLLWLCTFGLLGIGWLVDVILIPGMARDAQKRYRLGLFSYNVAWVAFVFLGIFGVHRFYLKKWVSGLIYLCTGGIVGLGLIYDFATLNEQIHASNSYEG